MDSLQNEDFISETVGLLILNELRIMRQNLKDGLMKLETKVDTILHQYGIEVTENSVLNSSKESTENNESIIHGNVNTVLPTKTLDFSLTGNNAQAKFDDEATEAAIFNTSDEVYTINIDVTDLPDDISLESYDEEENKDTVSSKVVKKSLVKKTKKKSGKKQ